MHTHINSKCLKCAGYVRDNLSQEGRTTTTWYSNETLVIIYALSFITLTLLPQYRVFETVEDNAV